MSIVGEQEEMSGQAKLFAKGEMVWKTSMTTCLNQVICDCVL